MEKLLVFTAPFSPNWSFEQLKGSRQKVTISVISMAVVLSILLGIYYLRFIQIPQSFGFYITAIPFAVGFLISTFCKGAIIAILISRVLKKPMKLINSVSIVAVSSLPIIIGSLSQWLWAAHAQILGLSGVIIFGITASIGISKFNQQPLKTSLLIVFATLLIMEFVRAVFTGVHI